MLIIDFLLLLGEDVDTTDPRDVDFNAIMIFVSGSRKGVINELGLRAGARDRRGYVNSKVGRSEDRDSP